MPLLDGDLMRSLPGFNQSNKSDPIVHARFFLPNGGLTWWVIEGQIEGTNYSFYGVVDAAEIKLDYFTLDDLEKLRGPSRSEVTRDNDFKPTLISQIDELKVFWEEWNESE